MLTVYARNTEVEIIDSQRSLDFLEANHRSGSLGLKGKTINLGLIASDGTLLGVAQFGTPRTAAKRREYSLELLRMAFLRDIRVIGGASKLIDHFIRIFNPSDFFTYQDMRGEATDVYSHAGMVLKKVDKQKEYLIAPGKTLETAARGEYYTMATVVQRGPDALLGTKLGERFHFTGKRKTNPELFLDLGWHIEQTPGDRIYEWINPNYSFYVYKITAKDSSKYYYGVSHVKTPEASEVDCLADGYWGSGGKKYSNWKQLHRATLSKEIVAVFSRKSLAYALEKKLIGNLFREDPNCLNSAIGGKDGRTNALSAGLPLAKKECPTHGLVKHRGDHCLKCQVKSSQSMRNCATHGNTLHSGNSCYKCSSSAIHYIGNCDIHGESTFSGEKCKRCIVLSGFEEANCEIHGLTTFKGNSCQKCKVSSIVSIRQCSVHGDSKFIADRCYSCISATNRRIDICPIHGEVKFLGRSCQRCAMSSRDSLGTCEIHGEVLHRGGSCITCSSGKAIELKSCPTHGVTKHKGDYCIRCVSASARSIRECSIHGLVPHRGESCDTCAAQRSVNLKNCLLHGETKHRGNSCYKCMAEKMVHTRDHLKTGVIGKDCSYCKKELTDSQ